MGFSKDFIRCYTLDAWSNSNVFTLIRPISIEETFPQKENVLKCAWPTQIFRWKNF
jgi:hypothetical protein